MQPWNSEGAAAQKTLAWLEKMLTVEFTGLKSQLQQG